MVTRNIDLTETAVLLGTVDPMQLRRDHYRYWRDNIKSDIQKDIFSNVKRIKFGQYFIRTDEEIFDITVDYLISDIYLHGRLQEDFEYRYWKLFGKNYPHSQCMWSDAFCMGENCDKCGTILNILTAPKHGTLCTDCNDSSDRTSPFSQTRNPFLTTGHQND